MKYSEIVVANSTQFEDAGLLKTAQDLAKILDHELFTIDLSAKHPGEMVDMRETIFMDFKSVCEQAIVEVHALEPELYQVHLPKRDEKSLEKVLRYKDSILSKLNGTKNSEIEMLLSVLEIFSTSFEGEYGTDIKARSIKSLINDLLVKNGKDPIYPAGRWLPSRLGEVTAPEGCSVLIIDDGKYQLMETARNIAGWPNLEIDFFHFTYDWDDKDILETKAAEIVALKPNIVLMDQGLGYAKKSLEGSELIKVIKTLTDTPPLFVANTGGMPDDLYAQGAFDNMNKAGSVSGLRSAIRRLK